MIKEAIVKIVSKGDLTYDEAYTVMNEIMSGQTTPTQNAAFLKMEDFDDFMDSGFYRTIFANTAAWLEELDRKQMLP